MHRSCTSLCDCNLGFETDESLLAAYQVGNNSLYDNANRRVPISLSLPLSLCRNNVLSLYKNYALSLYINNPLPLYTLSMTLHTTPRSSYYNLTPSTTHPSSPVASHHTPHHSLCRCLAIPLIPSLAVCLSLALSLFLPRLSRINEMALRTC